MFFMGGRGEKKKKKKKLKKQKKKAENEIKKKKQKTPIRRNCWGQVSNRGGGLPTQKHFSIIPRGKKKGRFSRAKKGGSTGAARTKKTDFSKTQKKK